MARPRRRNQSKRKHERSRFELYEAAVQHPERTIRFVEREYRRRTGREAKVLREDFCGTGLFSAMWVAASRAHRAVAVDRDPGVLRYGERNHRDRLGEAGRRMRYVRADVRRCNAKADVIVSLNFSYWVFRERNELLRYLRHARACLNPGGLLLLDLYGGDGATLVQSEKTRFPGFTYVWEQAAFDPINNYVVNHIHFELPGGRTIRRAFTYHWRLWTLPELRDLLGEAGYAATCVYFDTDAGFRLKADVSDYDAWVAMIVARPKS